MAEDTLGPDTFSTRGIPTSRRGYDRKVVDALVADAVVAWTALESRHRELVAAIERSGGLEYLERDLGAIAADVGRILTAATEAAEGLRSRAEADAARVKQDAGAAAAERLSAASSQAEAMITEADRQAYGLRRDAWDAGMSLLAGVRLVVDDVLAAAEDQAQVIRADAEKESHRRSMMTRKEAEEIIRNAKFEADRQLNMARELAQEMLDRVQGAESSVIPTNAERQRRREIMDQIERIRAERTIEDVTVLPAERAPTPGETPRVLFGVLDPQAPDLSDALAAEVESMRGDETTPRRSRSRAVEPTAPARRAAPPVPAADDVGTLFEALRVTAEHEPVAPDASGDPMALRDRLVLPLHNQGLRDTKRRIVDLQNAGLEALKVSRAWSPDQDMIAGQLGPAMEAVIQKAAAAGAEAARLLGGVAKARPYVGTRSHELVKAMAGDLASGLRGALSSGGGPAEVTATVSRVFRAWRGDQAERWVRAITFAAYHDSLLAAAAAGGVSRVVGVGTGRPCQACPGPGSVEWEPGGSPPEGMRVPPVDLDCLCTVRVVS